MCKSLFFLLAAAFSIVLGDDVVDSKKLDEAELFSDSSYGFVYPETNNIRTIRKNLIKRGVPEEDLIAGDGYQYAAVVAISTDEWVRRDKNDKKCATLQCFERWTLLAIVYGIRLPLPLWWKEQQNWDPSLSHCDWGGVTCNEMDLIVTRFAIMFPPQETQPEADTPIPKEINYLEALIELKIRGVNFEGGFDKHFLRSSKKMKFLDLANNQLQGTIPKGITKLRNLERLNLEDNKMDGTIPKKLFKKALNLKSLILGSNEFTGKIHKKIGKMSNLFNLDLSRNQLSGSIPSQIGKLKLGFLSLNNNSLTGKIPKTMKNLDQLGNVYINDNKFKGNIANSICKIQSLKDSVDSCSGSFQLDCEAKGAKWGLECDKECCPSCYL